MLARLKGESMQRYLLAHDLGTSGDKAVLFDIQSSAIVGDVVCEYPTSYPKDGWVEHDSCQWWDAVCNATKSLLDYVNIDASHIAAVSFSAIMNTCLPVNEQGNPLRSAMIWCDQRGKSEVGTLLDFATENEIYAKTGHRINGTYAIAKMLWFKRNQPQLFEKTYQFLQAKDYIIYKLTGQFATDYSDASHLGVLDQEKKCYWEELLAALDIPLQMLPPLKASTEVIGYVTKEAALATGLAEGTAIVMGGGDGCCATAGAGVYRPGLGYNILGTSSWNGTITDTMNLNPEKVTFSFVHLDGKQHVSIGTMQSAGHSLEWLLSTLYPDFSENKSKIFSDMNNKIFASFQETPDTKLLYLPYLLGERSPWWNSDARGCFIGLEASTTPVEMARACLEGVAFNLRIILEYMDKPGEALDMRIIGGGARNEVWLRILASVWNRPITVPKYLTEATSLGAILCAGVGIGVFKDFSVVET
ncbi:MAG: xylulokinase, partial [Sphaerochaetaceae bacterium]